MLQKWWPTGVAAVLAALTTAAPDLIAAYPKLAGYVTTVLLVLSSLSPPPGKK